MNGPELPPLRDLLADHDLLVAALGTPGFWNREMHDAFAGRSVNAVAMQPVGTGQVASVVRVDFELDDGHEPATGHSEGEPLRSAVVKTASPDQVGRMASAALRHAEVEVGFYDQLARTCAARTPSCFLARINTSGDDFVLVLEDLAAFTQADQILGMSGEEAAWAIDELAALHATWWGRVPPGTESFLVDRGDPAAHAMFLSMLHDGFAQRYGDNLEPEVLEAAQRLVDAGTDYLADRPGPTAVTHGDFRPDNLLVRRASAEGPTEDPGRPAAPVDRHATGASVAVVDWQTVTVGVPLADLSYFLGGALVPEVRAEHEPELLDRYRGRLAERGVELSEPELEDGYRRYALDGLAMAIGASQVVGQTDRGDAMFCTMARRSAQHALEAGTFDLLER